MNPNIQPTFMTFITGLEQQQLISLISDLIENKTIPPHTQATILRQNGFDIAIHEDITPITNHNFKKVLISYQTNYNGCSLYCQEAIDGTDVNVINESEELDEISEIICGAITQYTFDNGMTDDETCEFRGRTSDVEQICLEYARLYLGDAVEIEFELDNTST